MNDIDKFFRDSFEGHSSAYVPGAWERMEGMLDAGDKGFLAKNIQNYVLASIGAAIILAGSVVAYVAGYDNTMGTFAGNPHKTEQPIAVPNAAVDEGATGAVPATPNNTSTENTAATNGTIQRGESDLLADKPVINKTRNRGNQKNTTAATEAGEMPNEVILAEEDGNEEETVTEPTAPEKEAVTETNYEKRIYTHSLLGTRAVEIPQGAVTTALTDAVVETNHQKFTTGHNSLKVERESQNFYRLNYGLMLGINFNRVLSNTGATGYGSGLLAGLYAAKNISRHFDIGLEAAYMRRNSNSIARTITQTTYFFEKRTTNYYVLTKTMDYVQMPLSVSYKPTLKHRFTLGAVAAVMVDAHTEMSEMKQTTSETSTKITSEKGVYEDMNRWAYGIMAGYEYRLPGIYSIGLRYNQQLSNPMAVNYFNDSKKHLSADLQVYIKLNLSK